MLSANAELNDDFPDCFDFYTYFYISAKQKAKAAGGRKEWLCWFVTPPIDVTSLPETDGKLVDVQVGM